MPLVKPLLKKLAAKEGSALAKSLGRKQVSSATEKLAGTTMKLADWDEERIIQKIVKSGGDRRIILFTDGTSEEVSKEFIHRQTQMVGGGKHIFDVAEQGEETVFQAALKALDRNERMYETGQLNEFWTKKMIGHEYESYRRQAKKTGIPHAPYVLVKYKDRYVPISQQYADVLQEAGIVKIVRGNKK